MTTALTVTLWEILCLGALLGFSGNQIVAHGRDKQTFLKIPCVAIEVLILLDVEPIAQWNRRAFHLALSSYQPAAFVWLRAVEEPQTMEKEIF